MKRKLLLSSLLAASIAGVVLSSTNPAAAQDQPPGVKFTPPPTSIQPEPPDPRPAAAADGWKVETVMIHPKINTPSVVCALPDGRVLVAEHWLSNVGGKEPIDRILCLHPDGHITLFADKLYAVFGLQYVDGKVYVHHMPKYSVFTDDNGVGRDRFDILDQTSMPTIGGLNDHIPAQIHLAMDGYFYMAIGDRGFWGAKSKVDGRAGQLRGGGLVRIRPDGTGLEVYATGTRNHLDVSIDSEDEMFTYDNTDDGHGWWTRFTHMVDGGFYGYPYDYKPEENRNDPASKKTPTALDPSQPYRPYTLWRAAEYGGGSPTGAVGYAEDALPPEYRGNLFHCEWGKGKVQRFVVERSGGTFKVARQEDLLKNEGKGGDLRPNGICVTADGTGFWVTDWGYGGWMNKKEAGRLLKVTWTGKSQAAAKPAWYLPAAMGKPFTATTAELIEGLKHPAESVRLVAQRRIAERKGEAVTPLVALLNDAKAPPHARWFAIWTLDRIDDGKAGRDAIVAIVKVPKADVSVRRQAIRQLGQRQAKEATEAVAAALSDADASIRFRAATALGRIGDGKAVPAILAKLDEKDLFTRFALFTALNRIGAAEPSAWPAITRGLESADEAVRANTGYAMRNAYQMELVSALTNFVFDKTKAGVARAAALLAEAELHRQPKPWDGKWWGTQPVASPRPPKTEEWTGTTTVLSTIRDSLKDSDSAVRLAAVKAMQIAPDPTAADELVAMFGKETDAEIRRNILQALAAGKSPKAAPLAVDVLKNAKANAALVPDAVAVIQTTGAKEAGPALVAIAESNTAPEVLEPAFDALGSLKQESAVPAIAKHLGDKEPVVYNAAIGALSQIGGKQSAEALSGALTNDKRLEVRQAAAAALGQIKATSAIPALVQAAKEPRLQNEAVGALCKMPTVQALDAYVAALGGRNTQLKKNVQQALTRISTEAQPLLEAKAQAGQLPPAALAAIQEVYSVTQPLTVWSLIGPFDAEKPDPFPGDKPAQYPSKSSELKNAEGKPVKWRQIKTNAEHGMIDLGALVQPSEHVNCLLLAEFNSNADRDVEVLIGSDDFHTVWLNGRKIDEDTANSGWSFDERRVKAHVKSGKNIILARVGNDGGGYQFSLAITGERKGKLFEPVAAAAKKPDRAAYEKFAMTSKGDPSNGSKVFHNVLTVACAKCHQVSPTDGGGTIGPSLQGVGVKYDRAKLVESVLYPSKQIFDGYEQWAVKTKAGDVQWGVIRAETDREIVIYDSAAQKYVIPKAEVASRKKSEISLMPEGLEQGLTPQEFADLISYLESQKEKPPEVPKPAK